MYKTCAKNVFLWIELPSVSPQKQTYVVKEGEDASLSCHFTGAPILNVTWIHNNKALKWSTTNQPYLLNFQNVSRAATGNYTCEVTVNYKGTYSASETFNLVVLCKSAMLAILYNTCANPF